MKQSHHSFEIAKNIFAILLAGAMWLAAVALPFVLYTFITTSNRDYLVVFGVLLVFLLAGVGAAIKSPRLRAALAEPLVWL